MVGIKIRETRQAQQRSLADVAGEAGISVATLSRIENDKQTLDFELFLVIARVLKTSPHGFLAPEGNGDGDDKEPLARQIAALTTRERTQFWQNLASEQRAVRSRTRRDNDHQVGLQVEELLAQFDCLRDELESLKRRVRRR